VSGTTGIAGAADSVMVLARSSDGTVRLHLRGRDVIEQTRLCEFDDETGIWSVVGDVDDEPRPGDGLQGFGRRIFDCLFGAGIAMTPKQVADRISEDAQAVKNKLWRMSVAASPQVRKSVMLAGGYEAIAVPLRK
jgi:hypothetical protein